MTLILVDRSYVPRSRRPFKAPRFRSYGRPPAGDLHYRDEKPRKASYVPETPAGT